MLLNLSGILMEMVSLKAATNLFVDQTGSMALCVCNVNVWQCVWQVNIGSVWRINVSMSAYSSNETISMKNMKLSWSEMQPCYSTVLYFSDHKYISIEEVTVCSTMCLCLSVHYTFIVWSLTYFCLPEAKTDLRNALISNVTYIKLLTILFLFSSWLLIQWLCAIFYGLNDSDGWPETQAWPVLMGSRITYTLSQLFNGCLCETLWPWLNGPWPWLWLEVKKPIQWLSTQKPVREGLYSVTFPTLICWK